MQPLPPPPPASRRSSSSHHRGGRRLEPRSPTGYAPVKTRTPPRKSSKSSRRKSGKEGPPTEKVQVRPPSGRIPSSRERPSPPRSGKVKTGAPLAPSTRPITGTGKAPVASGSGVHKDASPLSSPSHHHGSPDYHPHYRRVRTGESWPPPGFIWWVNADPEHSDWQQRPPPGPDYTVVEGTRPLPYLRTVKIENLSND